MSEAPGDDEAKVLASSLINRALLTLCAAPELQSPADLRSTPPASAGGPDVRELLRICTRIRTDGGVVPQPHRCAAHQSL